MAKYTITIRTLMKNNFDFGLDSYPIFDENYRSSLNNNILYHYYESEIGFETANLFKFYLNQKLNEIMPYYNELYKAQRKLINENTLFDNVKLNETYTRETETSSESTSNSDGKNLFQDTPQGRLSFTDLENQSWATNYTMNKIDDTSETTGDGTEEFTRYITGNNGNKYNIDLLQDIKNKFMNIDLMIINDLNDLFMQIF